MGFVPNPNTTCIFVISLFLPFLSLNLYVRHVHDLNLLHHLETTLSMLMRRSEAADFNAGASGDLVNSQTREKVLSF